MRNESTQVWNACGYVRLSREDGDKEESNSVTGQKEHIRDYFSYHPELRECGMKVDACVIITLRRQTLVI